MAVTRRFVVALTVLLSLAAHAGSARMSLTVASGLQAEADYWPGESNRTAVLILHGFLQTRESPTVRRLAESLADEGLTVLLPSLTLGVNRRQQSVDCEALHTHTMEQDVEELRAWVVWLSERSGRRPVVVGHSAGGIQVAALLDHDRGSTIDRAVLISLTYFGKEFSVPDLMRLRARARKDLATDPGSLHNYALTFCRRYVSDPRSLLSYLSWDKDRLRQALRDTPVPVTVIYGGGDRRADPDWLAMLGYQGVALRRVPDANHFLDLAHEADLLDEVLGVIGGVNRG